jgi:hypothetical protein
LRRGRARLPSPSRTGDACWSGSRRPPHAGELRGQGRTSARSGRSTSTSTASASEGHHPRLPVLAAPPQVQSRVPASPMWTAHASLRRPPAPYIVGRPHQPSPTTSCSHHRAHAGSPAAPTAGRVQARRQLPPPGTCRLADSSSSPERSGGTEGKRRRAENAMADGKEDGVRAVDCGLPRPIPSTGMALATRRRWSCARTGKGIAGTALRWCPV